MKLMNSLIFSRKFFTTSIFCGSVNNVTIIGSGLMGSGIAQVFIILYIYIFLYVFIFNFFKVNANSGLKVVLVDRSDEILGKAMNEIKKSVSRIAKKKHENDEMVY